MWPPPCPSCHLILCKCDHDAAADCDSPEPSTARDAEFVAKTNAELARLLAECAKVRRGMPTHRTCDDRYACRHCAKLRDLNLLIDDHCEQLQIAELEAAFTEASP